MTLHGVYALLTVSNKSGIQRFAAGLETLGVRLVSTGKTADIIRSAEVDVMDASTFTGSPEMLGGKVKTLHPMIHAGIAGTDAELASAELKKYCIRPIRFVAVNFYPPEQMIDIGGPAAARMAAKGWDHGVTTIVDPDDYDWVLQELFRIGEVSRVVRLALARKAFAATKLYEEKVCGYMNTLSV